MNREELREKVADELTGIPIWENAAALGSDDAWSIADTTIRAVLSAVVDPVDGLMAQGRSDWARGFDDGTSAAADLIRALIEEGKNDE